MRLAAFLLAMAAFSRLALADPADEKPAEMQDRNTPADVGSEPMEKKVSSVSATVNPDQAALGGTSAKPWSILATTVTAVGVGTFVKDFYASDPYVDQALYIEPAYILKLPKDYRVRLSIREALDWEFTKPDNASNRYFNWSDALVGASSRLYEIPRANIDLWAAVRMAVPISAQSQQAGLYTSFGPSVGASRSFEWTTNGQQMSLLVRYDGGVRKNFNRTNVPIYSSDPNTAVIPTIVTRSTDALADGGLARGNASVDFSISNAILVSFSPHRLVSISVYVGMTNAFKYDIAPSSDPYTSSYAKPGPGRADELRSNIDVTVNLSDQLFLSGGTFTFEPPFAPNNTSLYNPFFNTASAANNYSTIYVGLSGQI